MVLIKLKNKKKRERERDVTLSRLHDFCLVTTSARLRCRGNDNGYLGFHSRGNGHIHDDELKKTRWTPSVVVVVSIVS